MVVGRPPRRPCPAPVRRSQAGARKPATPRAAPEKGRELTGISTAGWGISTSSPSARTSGTTGRVAVLRSSADKPDAQLASDVSSASDSCESMVV